MKTAEMPLNPTFFSHAGREAAPTRWRIVSAAAVAGGIALLLIQYLWRQSYWGDEVSILNNIVHKSFAQLFTGGLDHSQAAPPIFLAIQKLMALNFGSAEYSERFFPLVMAIAALAAFAGLAWKILPPAAATFALAVLCVSDKFIWHATEVKQYSGDVLCTIVLIWMALDTKSFSRFLWLSLIAAIMVWLSHPVVFVYATIVLCLTPDYFRRRQSPLSLSPSPSPGLPGGGTRENPPNTISLHPVQAWSAFLFGNFLFLLSFAALYWLSIRHQRDDSYLQDFWRDSFVNWSHPAEIPIWLLKQLWSVCDYVAAPISVAGIVLCGMMAVGMISWTKKRQWAVMGLCFGPLALVILAAAAGEYPLSGARVDFFLVPGLLLAAGEGVQALLNLLPDNRIWVGAHVAVILLPLIVVDARAVVLPRVRMHLRPVIAQLKLRRQADEPIFTTQTSVFHWYWPDAPGLISDNLAAVPPGGQRFWYVIAGKPDNLQGEEAPNLKQIGMTATEIIGERIIVRGGAGFCFVERAPASNQGQ
jgi:hypothetical protein